MSSPTNEDRSTWASNAISDFEYARRELSVEGGSKDRNVSVLVEAADSALSRFVRGSSGDPDEALADLLANLQHYAYSDEEDFDDLLARSKALVAAATPDDSETDPSIPATALDDQDSNPHVEFLAALQFWARGQTPAAGVTDVFEDAYQRAVINYEAEAYDACLTEELIADGLEEVRAAQIAEYDPRQESVMAEAKAPTKTTRRPR